MGIDIARLANHGMYYCNAAGKVQQIEQYTGLPVFISTYNNGEYTDPPAGFAGWQIYLDESKTLQQQIDEGDLISIDLTNNWNEYFYFQCSPHLINLHAEEFYFGRWFEMKYLADSIRQFGLPSPGNYVGHPCSWQLHNRQHYFNYCKNLGATAAVIFCDDKHGEWLEYFTERNWTMEQFVEWGRQQFNFVTFQQLTTFHFPEKEPDYYNVFIYDDFAELK